MLKTVKVPQQFEPIFQKAQESVAKFFSEKKEEPSKGTIEIFGERYILVRAASMSVDFFETVAALYEKEGKEEANNIARQLLFDIAHAIGKQDARSFHKKMNLQDPIEKLSAGPVHFAHAGWAFVDIFPESSPSPDENCYLIYDHPYSFESGAWRAAGKKPDFPVCIMNAGYSSGWCEESFGLGLVATEIMCQAKGDPACRFIMAPPSRVEGHIAAYLKKEPELAKRISHYEVPGFFKRKEAEEALRESEERFRTIFDKASDGILLADAESRQFLMGNEAISKMLGYSQEELRQLGVRDIHPREDLPSTLEAFEKLVKGEIGLTAGRSMLRKDGSIFYADIRAGSIKIGARTYLLGTFRDITERKQAENKIRKLNEELEVKVKELLEAQGELVRKEKLATLGQLAGSVGHELRNPLGVMSNAVYYLKTVLPGADETVKEYLNIIKGEINNSERIISDLIDFTRTKVPQVRSVTVKELISQSLGKCVVPEGVTLQLEIPDTLPMVNVDPHQMGQVFQNLITNGIQAMPEGGLLTIQAKEDREDGTVEISVTDTGVGIKPENMAKIFQPLFTTKARGIGLGLIVSKNLVEANGGRIGVESELGKGTTFTVVLPEEQEWSQDGDG